MTFHKYTGEESPYVRFRYLPQKICNHTQGQVLGSMNNDPLNSIYKSQQSTKEGFVKSFKDVFDHSKQLIDVNNQLHTTVPLTTTFHKPVGGENMYVQFG